MIRALASCIVETPPGLATAMVNALGDSRDARWLDPCVGEGVFVRALAESGVPSRRITAVDLEKEPSPSDVLATTVRGTDFVAWSLRTDIRFDRIVANPPYLSLDRLRGRLKEAALRITAPGGIRVRPGSNYWYVFLCASLQLLKPGGSICFVLPAAWTYANYAAPLRDAFPRWFSHVEIHRSHGRLFGAVQDGCVVLLGRGLGTTAARHIRMEHASADGLVRALGEPGIGIKREATKRRFVTVQSSMRPLKEVLQIRLGGVSGDVSYFLMTEKKRRELNLPVGSMRPLVSKARQLRWGVLTKARWRTLRDNGERVWLFDPPRRLRNHPAVRKYIDFGKSGGCNQSALKITRRRPWYRTPLPRHIHGFMSGMSQDGPWISLRAMPSLAASNTLYVVRFTSARRRDEQAAWALSLLTSRTRKLVKELRRVYTDGLTKYEPGDLSFQCSFRGESLVPRQFISRRSRPYSLDVRRTVVG